MSLRGFSTISFWADDVAAAVAWYTEFLGVEAYFMRSGPDGRPAYAEFRIGDYQGELGIIDRDYGPPGATTSPAAPAEEFVVGGQRGEGRGTDGGRAHAASRARGGRGRQGGRTLGGGVRVAARLPATACAGLP